MIVYRSILGQMIDMFDSVEYSSAGGWRRKLWALALVSSFQADAAASLSLERFPEVVNIVDQVLCEEEEDRKTGAGGSGSSGSGSEDCIDEDADDSGVDSDLDSGPLATHYLALIQQDVVCTTSIGALLGEKMRLVQGMVGEGAFVQGLTAHLGEVVVQRVVGRFGSA